MAAIKKGMVLTLALGVTATGVFLMSSIAGATHPHPKGAKPLRVPLVPAYTQCATPNRTHGPPLAFASCNPPVHTSSFLTFGTPDANGAAANSTGSIRINVLVGTPGPPDDTDVIIKPTLSDVRCKSGTSACGSANAADGPDYTGELQGMATIRITDHFNGTSPGGGTDAATVRDIPFPFNMLCRSTADASTGGLCGTPGAECLGCPPPKEGQRTIVEMTQIQVFDGGPDGYAATLDNTLFAVQGIFVP